MHVYVLRVQLHHSIYIYKRWACNRRARQISETQAYQLHVGLWLGAPWRVLVYPLGIPLHPIPPITSNMAISEQGKSYTYGTLVRNITKEPLFTPSVAHYTSALPVQVHHNKNGRHNRHAYNIYILTWMKLWLEHCQGSLFTPSTAHYTLALHAWSYNFISYHITSRHIAY